MKILFTIMTILISSSMVCAADTWKPISRIENSDNNTKTMLIQLRYDGYPDYYTESLYEADCEKNLLRGGESKVYTLDGKLVNSYQSDRKPPYYGWMPPLSGTPSQEIFDAICLE